MFEWEDEALFEEEWQDQPATRPSLAVRLGPAVFTAVQALSAGQTPPPDSLAPVPAPAPRMGQFLGAADMASGRRGDALGTDNPLPLEPHRPGGPPPPGRSRAAVGRTTRRGPWITVAPLQREAESEGDPGPALEYLGQAAREAESEAEAEAFIGAMVPLAAQLVPGAAPALLRNATPLIQGAAALGRAFRRHPRTRPLVAALPAIVQRTAGSLAQRTAAGLPVPPQRALQALGRQAERVLASPGMLAQTLRRSRQIAREYEMEMEMEGFG